VERRIASLRSRLDALRGTNSSVPDASGSVITAPSHEKDARSFGMARWLRDWGTPVGKLSTDSIEEELGGAEGLVGALVKLGAAGIPMNGSGRWLSVEHIEARIVELRAELEKRRASKKVVRTSK
jgi:hypothetical protein